MSGGAGAVVVELSLGCVLLLPLSLFSFLGPGADAEIPPAFVVVVGAGAALVVVVDEGSGMCCGRTTMGADVVVDTVVTVVGGVVVTVVEVEVVDVVVDREPSVTVSVPENGPGGWGPRPGNGSCRLS